MGYSRRKATAAKLELPTRKRKEVELVFNHQIVGNVKKGSDNKRVITAATFTVMLHGKFLDMQLNYEAKTVQSLLQFKFPQEFSLSANKKCYSSEAELIKLIKMIILPSVKEERKRLGKPDQAVKVISDVFRGQIYVESFQGKQHQNSFCPGKHDKSSVASRPNRQRLCQKIQPLLYGADNRAARQWKTNQRS